MDPAADRPSRSSTGNMPTTTSDHETATSSMGDPAIQSPMLKLLHGQQKSFVGGGIQGCCLQTQDVLYKSV